MSSTALPSEEIQVRNSDLAEWNSADAVMQRIQRVQQIYRGVMKSGTHFGTIPGCGDKPTLLKAGSEQLLMTFKLAVTPEVIDLSTGDCARYRVVASVTHAPSGTYLGSGVGECSSDEAKFKWRSAVCDEEFEATPAERRRLKWKKGRNSAYTEKQVRQDFSDVANTVLKIAKKRAQIDATLTVTAASDIFTQDIEDMEHPVEAEEASGTPVQTTAMPQRKSQPTENTQPAQTAAPTLQACPDCGKAIPIGASCSQCGWGRERTEPIKQTHVEEPRRPAAIQQVRQPNPAAKPPEPRQSGAPKISEAQARRFFGIAMGAGITKEEQRNYLMSKWGLSSDRDITRDIYEECCAWAEGGGQ